MRKSDVSERACSEVGDLPLTAEEMAYIIRDSRWEDICYTYETNLDNEATRRFYIRKIFFEILLAERCIATGEEPWLLLPKDKVDEVLSAKVMEKLLFYIKAVEKKSGEYYKEFKSGKYIPKEYFTLISKAVHKGIDIEKEPEKLRKVLFNDKNTRSFKNEKYTTKAFEEKGRGNYKSMLIRRQIEHMVITEVMESYLNIEITEEDIENASLKNLGVRVTGGHTKYGKIDLSTFYKIRDEAIAGEMKLYFNAKLQKAYCLLKDNMSVFEPFVESHPNIVKKVYGKVRIENGEFEKNQSVIFLYVFSKVYPDQYEAIKTISKEIGTSDKYDFTEFGKALLNTNELAY